MVECGMIDDDLDSDGEVDDDDEEEDEDEVIEIGKVRTILEDTVRFCNYYYFLHLELFVLLIFIFICLLKGLIYNILMTNIFSV